MTEPGGNNANLAHGDVAATGHGADDPAVRGRNHRGRWLIDVLLSDPVILLLAVGLGTLVALQKPVGL
jgi:hypothetical protein